MYKDISLCSTVIATAEHNGDLNCFFFLESVYKILDPKLNLLNNSDTSYSCTDSPLVTVGYQLRFLACNIFFVCTRSADLA